ncbi:MAG: hypothetical protein GXO60_01805 [Epsilonproteobacteria bacterium]|nr:hypothetical protein [Campylobacterota bacterium]
MKSILSVALLIVIMGCSGENRVKISGVISKQSDKKEEFFVVKDKESGKVYRFDKKSEKEVADKVGHNIKMKGKILNSSDTTQVATVSICTKCHHSFKID